MKRAILILNVTKKLCLVGSRGGDDRTRQGYTYNYSAFNNRHIYRCMSLGVIAKQQFPSKLLVWT